MGPAHGSGFFGMGWVWVGPNPTQPMILWVGSDPRPALGGTVVNKLLVWGEALFEHPRGGWGGGVIPPFSPLAHLCSQHLKYFHTMYWYAYTMHYCTSSYKIQIYGMPCSVRIQFQSSLLETKTIC